jgi:hypothetical protein
VAFGHAQLVRSAEATGAALAVALIGATVIVVRRAGAFVPAATAGRVGVALALCYAAGLVIPRVSRVVTPALSVGVVVAYVAVLVLTGEVGRADLAMVRSLRRRKATPAS